MTVLVPYSWTYIYLSCTICASLCLCSLAEKLIAVRLLGTRTLSTLTLMAVIASLSS